MNEGKSYSDYGLQFKEITAMIDMHLNRKRIQDNNNAAARIRHKFIHISNYNINQLPSNLLKEQYLR